MMTIDKFNDGGDLRCETLLQTLKDVIYERGSGLPMPLIIGTIRLLEYQILKEQYE